jgi:hypothetical protein
MATDGEWPRIFVNVRRTATTVTKRFYGGRWHTKHINSEAFVASHANPVSSLLKPPDPARLACPRAALAPLSTTVCKPCKHQLLLYDGAVI